jgi:hypothetical protein
MAHGWNLNNSGPSTTQPIDMPPVWLRKHCYLPVGCAVMRVRLRPDSLFDGELTMTGFELFLLTAFASREECRARLEAEFARNLPDHRCSPHCFLYKFSA